jgi:hypothetical protein
MATSLNAKSCHQAVSKPAVHDMKHASSSAFDAFEVNRHEHLILCEELAYQNMRKQKDGGTMPWRSVVLGKSVPRTRQGCGLCVYDGLLFWLSIFIYNTSFSFNFPPS